MSEESTSKPVEIDEPGDEAAPGEDRMAHASGHEAEAEAEADADAEPAEQRRGSLAGLIARTLVGVALLAGIGVLVVWWQSRPVPQQVSPEDLFVLQSLEDTQAALQRLEDRNQALEAELAAYRSRVDSLGGVATSRSCPQRLAHCGASSSRFRGDSWILVKAGCGSRLRITCCSPIRS